MKKIIDEEKLRQLLEWLGALMLFTDRRDNIEISHQVAAEIVAVLSSLPEGKAGRPKAWTYDTEILAVFDMLWGTPLNALAKEIAKKTGQPEPSARRRLQELKKSRRFTNWRR
jgi:hypothetical protein